MTQPKQLHVGKTMDDLEVHYQLPKSIGSKKVMLLCQSAVKLKEHADLNYLQRDEELAYVSYMKFLNLVDTIKRNREYSEKKSQILTSLGTNSEMIPVYDKLTKLKKSLQSRYATLNASKMRELNKIRNERDNITPLVSHVKYSINAKELFEMINDSRQSMLIMDCRPEKDFESSRIKYEYVLNVPEALLVSGMTAGKIHSKLVTSSKALFSSRGVKEQIVLMDYNTSGAPAKETPLWVLNNVLNNWDEDVTYKKPLLRVEDGYKSFSLCYPMCCINPNYKPTSNEVIVERFEDIEYPNISDIRMKDDSFGSQQDRPLVNRDSKAAALHIYETKSVPKQDILAEQEKIVDKSIQNEMEMLTAETELKNIHAKEEGTADDEEKLQLVEKSKTLMYKLMQLENKQKDYETENNSLREQIKQYEAKERSLQQRGESISRQEAVQLEEAAQKRIKEKEDEQKRCELERVRLAQEREAKLKLAREQKRHLKENLDDGDIRQPKIPQFDRTAKPTNVLSDYNHNVQHEVQRDFAPVYGNVGRGLTGLKNLGNTCYMNSILQCLSNTTFLTEYFVDGQFRQKLNRNNKTQGKIVEEVAAVIKALWTGQYRCIASKNLRYVVGQYERQFGGIEQQDSHEFLTILMDWLHSDLQTVPMEITCSPENLPASEKAWVEYLKGKESYISQLFYGQIKSTVKCIRCLKESATYESFSNLSLELPPDANRCYLGDCLDLYFNGEHIRGWNCPQCKSNQEAIKKLDISRLPSILVIHFKRFYADPDAISTVYRKKQNYVRFPLYEFDVSSYIAPSELNRNKRLRKSRYHLYGVSNHYGSMESGHYTAFCRNSTHQKWYKFDDHTVSSLDTSDVCSSAAYILFYSLLPEQQQSEMPMR